MELCTEKIIENYLLYKNPLYAFRLPIGLLLGIFMVGYLQLHKVSNNTYINHILIPITCVLVVIVLCDMIARMMLSNEEKRKLMLKCKLFMSQPKMKNHRLKPDLIVTIENYDGNIEEFTRNKNGDSQTNPHIEVSELPKEMSEILPDLTMMNEYKENKEGYENFDEHAYLKEIQRFEGQVHAYEKDMSHREVPYTLPKKESQPSPCIQGSDCCQLCSNTNNPCGVVTAIPGPQYLPYTASAKQEQIKRNEFTPSLCPI